MKGASTWLWAGISSLLLVGLSGLLLGWLLPGSNDGSEAKATSSKSQLSETKKKADQSVNELTEMIHRATLLGTNRLTHRVFVSRTLVYLPEDKQEPVQPLKRDLKMQDGIDVGWKLDHGFDPSDPDIKDADSDQDGFTNLEEYQKGTNPNDPNSSPSRWVKIKIASVETNSIGIGFSGISGDRFTVRYMYLGKKKDLDVVIGDQLWLVATTQGLQVLKSEEEAKKFKDTCPHPIPMKIKTYHKDKNTRLDEKTNTRIDYDDSYLEIERGDALGGVSKIMLDERGKARGVVWAAGDIRLISLVPGEGEIGPFRVGQSFPYAGKEFLVREATPSKVTLWMTPEGEEVQILPKTP